MSIGEGTLFTTRRLGLLSRTTLEGGAPLAAVCFPSIVPRAAIYQNTKYRLVYDSSIPRYPKEVKAGSPAGPVFIAEAAM